MRSAMPTGLRIERVLRGEFPHDDVEKCDHREPEGHGDRGDERLRSDAEERKERVDELRDIRLAEPAEREARHGDAELRRGKVGVEARGDVAHQLGALVPLLDERIELRAADFDERKFRRHEKRVHPHDEQDRDELEYHVLGRAPTLSPLIPRQQAGGVSSFQ